jgi:hypothetical protein
VFLESGVAGDVDLVISQVLSNPGRIEPITRPRDIAIGFGDPRAEADVGLSIAGRENMVERDALDNEK